MFSTPFMFNVNDLINQLDNDIRAYFIWTIFTRILFWFESSFDKFVKQQT